MLDETKRILADLIAFPSVSSDSNLDMIAYLAERLEDCGARVEVLSDESGTKANLWATLGAEVDGGIVLSGHTDVVPVTDQDWSSDPFRMEERDGHLYGRGACDMKGFIAACLALAPQLATQVGTRPLHFAFTYDEEVGCIGAGQLAEALKARDISPIIAIIGEPTNMRVVEGHKGCYEYTTRFQGLEAHGSAPEMGVNAIEYAVRYAGRLLELRDQLPRMAPPDSRFEPPWTTLNIGALRGGNAHNVIAPRAQLDWEMRPVQGDDAIFVKDAIRIYCDEVLLPSMRAVHPGATIETEVVGEVAGLVPTEANEARRLLTKLTGANSAEFVPFGTEAGIFQALGIDVAVCGPGSIQQAHKANEFLSLDQLQQCLGMLERLGGELHGPS